MADPTPPSVSPRARGDMSPNPPTISARWGFWKGLLTGLAIEIPVLAATVWVLARLGVGDPDAGFMRIMRLTTVFAGIAAVLTAGGIGRLAAHASVEGGRRRAVIAGARAHAVASAGLVIIATIPHGHLPTETLQWYPMPLAGLISGSMVGALIGAVCSGTAPVGFADVWSIARKPTEALRQLLSPEDIIKLGSALRSRTSTMFEGMFEPSKPPPPTDRPVEVPPTAAAPAQPPAKDE